MKCAKKFNFPIVLSLLVICSLTQIAQAKNRWGVTVSGTISVPLGTLADRFTSETNYSAGLSKWNGGKLVTYIDAEYYDFSTINESKLEYSDLDLRLQIWGTEVCFCYYPFLKSQFKLINPYFGGGAGIYYWKNRVGPYTILMDNVDTPIDELIREEFTWGFNVKYGVDCRISRNIGLNISMSYKLVPVSLWPTSLLFLDEVNGLHFFNTRISLSYNF